MLRSGAVIISPDLPLSIILLGSIDDCNIQLTIKWQISPRSQDLSLKLELRLLLCPALAWMARMEMETPVFFAIFSGFCPYVTGFLPLCHLCLKYLKPQVWQLPYLPYWCRRPWTFVMESHSKTGREFLVFGINCAFLTFSSFPLYGIKNIPLKDICSFFSPICVGYTILLYNI